MSPPRRQPSPDQPPEDSDGEGIIFPDLEGVENTLDQISRTQENTIAAIKLVYDNLDRKLDDKFRRLEDELRREHQIIIEKENTLITEQALIKAWVMNGPKPTNGAPPVPTNINIGSNVGATMSNNINTPTPAPAEPTRPGTETSGGFSLGINLNAILKTALAVLLFAVSIWIIAQIGAKVISLKSGDKEATIIFDERGNKKIVNEGDHATTSKP